MNNYINDIKLILAEARHKAYAAINSAMVEAYWKVGERIVLQEQGGESRAAYGEQVLKELSMALTTEFGKGFSSANLRNMRQFYLTYPDIEKCYALRSKLSWTHHRLIMRVENAEARDYYLREALRIEDTNLLHEALEYLRALVKPQRCPCQYSLAELNKRLDMAEEEERLGLGCTTDELLKRHPR